MQIHKEREERLKNERKSSVKEGRRKGKGREITEKRGMINTESKLRRRSAKEELAKRLQETAVDT